MVVVVVVVVVVKTKLVVLFFLMYVWGEGGEGGGTLFLHPRYPTGVRCGGWTVCVTLTPGCVYFVGKGRQ